MIDLHCHILPQMDDGAHDLDEALHMAHLAVRSGVTDIVVTPHCMDGGAQPMAENVAMLQEVLQEIHIPLRLYPGMEIFATPDTARLLQQGSLLTLNGSRYPLVEFDFVSDGEQETQILQSILQAGYIPLVAHPERYEYTQQDPQLLNLWVSMGCLLQVNKGSVLGRFGERTRQLALAMVDRGFATVVASDAHAARMRTPYLYDTKTFLERHFTPIAAEVLLRDNPWRILNNKQIPSVTPEWFE